MILLILLGVLLVAGFVFIKSQQNVHNQQQQHQPSLPNQDVKVENTKVPTGLDLYQNQEDKERNEVAHAMPIDQNRHPVRVTEPYSQYQPLGGDPYATPGGSVPTGWLMSGQSIRNMHPVLAYQYMHDKAINPANLGDPIRIPDVAGAKGDLYGSPRNFFDTLRVGPSSVPVPMGSLKMTSEKYNKDMFRFNPLATGTIASPILNGIGTPTPVTPPGYPLPYQGNPASTDFFKPYGPNFSGSQVGTIPFIGSVNAYAPFPSIENPWEKAGILTSQSVSDNILNLYRRPIAPLQDLWEYQVQDKNGFVIKLENTKYLEDGDIVPFVIGKQNMGPWKAHIFVQNKYIWV